MIFLMQIVMLMIMRMIMISTWAWIGCRDFCYKLPSHTLHELVGARYVGAAFLLSCDAFHHMATSFATGFLPTLLRFAFWINLIKTIYYGFALAEVVVKSKVVCSQFGLGAGQCLGGNQGPIIALPLSQVLGKDARQVLPLQKVLSSTWCWIQSYYSWVWWTPCTPFVLCLEALLLVRFRWADICDNLLEGGCSNDLSPWTWNSSQGLLYSLPGQGEGGETWKESTWLDF